MMVQVSQSISYKMKKKIEELEYTIKKKNWALHVMEILAIMISIFYFIALINIVSAQQQSLGDDFILFQNVTLIQNCECSEVVFTRVINPSNVVILNNETAVQNNTAFSYLMNGTLNNQFGVYTVTGHGNLTLTGTLQTFAYTYEIKRNGGIFAFDLTDPLTLILAGFYLLAILGLLVTKNNFWAGIMIFGGGILISMNGGHWLPSLVIIVMGVLIAGRNYNK